MRVLVVGGYGFIGREVCSALLRRGHQVVGWGRSAAIGRSVAPDAEWIEGDLRHMLHSDAWSSALSGIDAVVNASGALQDGAGGRLAQVQGDAIIALVDACVKQGVGRFVQISAPGAEAGASTAFMTTKALADAHLRRSRLEWTILRPALVVGRNAYGGTALVRALAALPIGLSVYGGSPVQCVALDDVATVSADAVEGLVPAVRILPLAAPERLRLHEVIAAHRRWLGFPKVRLMVDLPPLAALPLAACADVAGWLGWRSPLRSTALRVMRDGVLVEASYAPPTPLQSLREILAAHPAGVQDRIAARIFWLLPLVVLALATLWIGSGLIGLGATARAASIIGGGADAELLVRACSFADLALGCAILIRPWARPAAVCMATASAGYLIAGSLVAPWLWSDPLAPLLKIVPALLLALVAAAILEKR
ncbi:SDR family oxidoreductase [Sphingomonas crusticola]|uniref:SDR family oxidoreductase n=1 Tax=Sphingomonas crusticola TaxID=1697973 RepID=UPI000E286734|nr:SDR family oxidoreductase [Sphingomonas crusticola]